MKDEVGGARAGARAVAAALGEVAAQHADLALPGYTHLQPAMPSSVALWAGGFAAELEDDAQGLEGCLRRIDQNPLGSAAGYGTPGLTIDREATRAGARLRGNRGAGHRGAALARQGRGAAPLRDSPADEDCGRLAADLVLFATSEFAFVELPEAMTTGSSIMPQKRNPDLFELVRGRRRDDARPADRGAGDSGQAPLRLPPRPAAAQGARSSAPATWRARPPSSSRRPSPACAFCPPQASFPLSSSRPKRPIVWSSKRASPSARRIGGWRRVTAQEFVSRESCGRAGLTAEPAARRREGASPSFRERMVCDRRFFPPAAALL